MGMAMSCSVHTDHCMQYWQARVSYCCMLQQARVNGFTVSGTTSTKWHNKYKAACRLVASKALKGLRGWLSDSPLHDAATGAVDARRQPPAGVLHQGGPHRVTGRAVALEWGPVVAGTHVGIHPACMPGMSWCSELAELHNQCLGSRAQPVHSGPQGISGCAPWLASSWTRRHTFEWERMGSTGARQPVLNAQQRRAAAQQVLSQSC